MDAARIAELIKEWEIDTIRIDYADLHGVCRNKMLPAIRIEEILEEGMTCAQPIFAIMLDNNIAPDTGVADEVSYGDMKILPDPSTFARIPYMPNVARFIGDLYVDGQPWANSPRQLLKRVIDEYATLGLKPIVASELEFYAFTKEDGCFYSEAPANCYTCTPRNDPLDILGQLSRTVTEMGFEVLYYNHEFFQGQYEFNWKHTEALRQADQCFTFKAVAKELGFRNGLDVTFMGRPKADAGGSGMHMHFSMEDPAGNNLFADPSGELGMSDIMRHFIAGQLKHAKAMTAFLAPTVNSYKRIMPDSFAPFFIGWGLDNRTVYIRVPSERGKATRVELRAGCASANSYLAIAAGLITGLEGIKAKLDPGAPFEGDLYRTEEHETVPLSLYGAIKELNADAEFQTAMGPPLVQNFLAIKNAEVESYRTAVTDWDYNYYGYHL